MSIRIFPKLDFGNLMEFTFLGNTHCVYSKGHNFESTDPIENKQIFNSAKNVIFDSS